MLLYMQLKGLFHNIRQLFKLLSLTVHIVVVHMLFVVVIRISTNRWLRTPQFFGFGINRLTIICLNNSLVTIFIVDNRRVHRGSNFFLRHFTEFHIFTLSLTLIDKDFLHYPVEASKIQYLHASRRIDPPVLHEFGNHRLASSLRIRQSTARLNLNVSITT